MNQLRQGGCQCGTVRYEVVGDPVMVGACHCSDCQRQSGSAFGMSFIVAREAFRLLSGNVKTFTRTADSGRAATCTFCPECGTQIYQEPDFLKDMVSVKPGTLDDTSFLRPTFQVWVERKHSWVSLSADIPTFERQPE
jgi:hypothetical protein